jgi:hypothetical protein
LFHESRDPAADDQVIDEAVSEAKLAEDQGMDVTLLLTLRIATSLTSRCSETDAQ